MLTLIGAGSVGLGIGARVARSGEPVRFLVRRPEVAATLEAEGVRLEDLCHLGPEGLEVLTPLPYALDPRAWR